MGQRTWTWVLAAASLYVAACGPRPAPTASAASTPARQPFDTGPLSAVIEAEIRDKGIPGFAIALVSDGEVLWTQGFGTADPDADAPMSADTVVRVGSVSKLFTALATMQQVERGALDLDAPITRVLPDFVPRGFDPPATLRQLMSHRSGLVREPPVGHYFDPTQPSIRDTVMSLRSTARVYPAGKRVKYSNAGVTVVGHAIERVANRPFAEVVRDDLIGPIGLESTDFELTKDLRPRLAHAQMWTRDGRSFDAPGFRLGTAPAGNLYSTVSDLARFLVVLMDRGQADDGRIVSAESLAQMWTPQLTRDEGGFGLGFHVSRPDGLRVVRHGGAVYGFATEVALLPDARIGVAAVATLDVANAVVSRIVRHAIDALVAGQRRRPAPEFVHGAAIGDDEAATLIGRWAHRGEIVEVTRSAGCVMLARRGTRAEIRRHGDRLVVDDRHAFGTTVERRGERLRIDDVPHRRLAIDRPEPPPKRWRGLVGEYGWDHNVLYIVEHAGRLHALIEWHFQYPLTEEDDDVFAFPDYGMYHGERLTFVRGPGGRATKVTAAGIEFERRLSDVDSGKTFRIEPVAPIASLRASAMAATPPAERDKRDADLVELIALDSSIELDIRYATTNNFTGAKFYRQARAFMEREPAEALVRVHRGLRKHGFGLLIHDAYRPWHVTKMFWDATPEDKKPFVADPSHGSRHNRGAAVDLTLYQLDTGKAVAMVAGYDEFTDRSHADYPGGTELQRWHRQVLRSAMEAEGFVVYPPEWWHFDFRGWADYPISNLAFEDLGRAPR